MAGTATLIRATSAPPFPNTPAGGAEVVLHVDNQQRRVLRPNDFVKLIVDLSSCEFAHDQSPAATRSRISALLVSRRTVKSGGR